MKSPIRPFAHIPGVIYPVAPVVPMQQPKPAIARPKLHTRSDDIQIRVSKHGVRYAWHPLHA